MEQIIKVRLSTGIYGCSLTSTPQGPVYCADRSPVARLALFGHLQKMGIGRRLFNGLRARWRNRTSLTFKICLCIANRRLTLSWLSELAEVTNHMIYMYAIHILGLTLFVFHNLPQRLHFRHFPTGVFCILIRSSLKCVQDGPIHNKSCRFMQWLGTVQAKSHYLKLTQCWPSSMMLYGRMYESVN